MVNEEEAVVVENLYKSFRLPHEKSSSIKHSIVNALKGRKGYEIQHVLEDVSFEIKKGEFFGIVGRNGSGKSTLLKLLSNIYIPNKGNIRINGNVTPFIELGVGFNQELTGRENVFMNGALLGFSKSEVEAMYDDVVGFAELEKFMDQKLKNYSSGMQVRLAFSIAIQAKTDILILDEVLAVGDEAFQKKCFEYFGNLKANGQTVILVTHDMSSVERFCSRAMLIEKGKIQYIGDKTEVAYLYNELFNAEEEDRLKQENEEKFDTNREKDDGDQKIHQIFITQGGRNTTQVKSNQDFEINFEISSRKKIDNVVFGFHIYNSQGNFIAAVNTEERGMRFNIEKGTTKINVPIENIYTDDTYTINVAFIKRGESSYLFHKVNIFKFSISGTKYLRNSLTHPRTKITIQHIK